MLHIEVTVLLQKLLTLIDVCNIEGKLGETISSKNVILKSQKQLS